MYLRSNKGIYGRMQGVRVVAAAPFQIMLQ